LVSGERGDWLVGVWKAIVEGLSNGSWLLKDGNKKRGNGYMDSGKWKLVVEMKKLVYGNRLLEKGK